MKFSLVRYKDFIQKFIFFCFFSLFCSFVNFLVVLCVSITKLNLFTDSMRGKCTFVGRLWPHLNLFCLFYVHPVFFLNHENSLIYIPRYLLKFTLLNSIIFCFFKKILVFCGFAFYCWDVAWVLNFRIYYKII